MRLDWKAGATSTHCGSLWTFPTRSPLLTGLGGRAQGQDLPPSGLSHPRFLRLSPSLIGRASSPLSWAQFPGRLWMAGRPPYPRPRPGPGPGPPLAFFPRTQSAGPGPPGLSCHLDLRPPALAPPCSCLGRGPAPHPDLRPRRRVRTRALSGCPIRRPAQLARLSWRGTRRRRNCGSPGRWTRNRDP